MTLTPGQMQTAKATAARKRITQERLAKRLREAGWICIQPEYNLQAIEGGPEWGVIWPDPEHPDDPEIEVFGTSEYEARRAARMADSGTPARVVTCNTHVVYTRTDWVDAPPAE